MDTKVMFNIGYGLYVLTAKDEKDNGCIINTVMQVTSNPLQIVIALNNLIFQLFLKKRISKFLSTLASNPEKMLINLQTIMT